MPYITVKLVGKLSRKQKEELVEGITDLLEKVTGKEPKYTHIFIEEIKRENLGIEGKLLG